MPRFVHSTLTPRPLLLGKKYLTDEVLPLQEALQSIVSRIDQLDRLVQTAQDRCHFPGEDDLTREESAAIYLVTMKLDESSLHELIERDLASDDRSIAESWFAYLALLHTALRKLPNKRMKVWHGVNGNTLSEIHRGDEVIWSNITSCSTSVDRIKTLLTVDSTLLLIDTVNAKNISPYSNQPDEQEVILCPGTCLRVLTDRTDQKPFGELHLQEVTRANASGESRPLSWKKKTALLLLLHVLVVLIGLLLASAETPSWRILRSSIRGLLSFRTSETHVDAMGNTYQGEWKNGKKHDHGQIDYANGNKYVGDWVEDMATGEGTFTWANGDRYEGQFKEGRRHGKGSYLFANGDQYVGDWVEDKKVGQGVSTWGPGSVWTGDKYEGEYMDDKKHGKGMLFFASGDSYIGDWIDDQQEGEGIFNWANGDRYEGSVHKSFSQHPLRCDVDL